MARRTSGPQDEIDPHRSSRDEFYPRARNGGVVVRIQTDYSRPGRLPRYSLALIDTRATGTDNGRILGYDNAHEYHHRHYLGKDKIVAFESYESIETRFEAEVRKDPHGRDI